MKPLPSCLPCVLHQALRFARAAADDDWSQRKVMNEVLRCLPDADWNQTPAELLASVFEAARSTLRVADPFAALRAEADATLGILAAELRERLTSAEDPLALATEAAAAANLVDELVFERFSQGDPRELFEAALAQGFSSGSPADMADALSKAEGVLYLCDNAGELHFDALLMEQFLQAGKRVTAVLRGPGLLHDATLSESEGLPAAVVRVVLKEGQQGMPHVGRSSDLGAALEQAQLVIAKGSSNYETFHSDAHDVIHLLRAKCPPVANSLGVSPGSLVLHRVPPTG